MLVLTKCEGGFSIGQRGRGKATEGMDKASIKLRKDVVHQLGSILLLLPHAKKEKRRAAAADGG